jgi:hypothetical protein
MVIQGTDKIRGCVVMANPKLEIKKAQTMRISDSDYEKPDMQTAIASGLIKVLEAPGKKPIYGTATVQTEASKIKCRNVYNRPLGMNFFPREIAPDEDFFLTTDQLKEPEVREAIDKGYIKVYKDPKKETTINLQELAAQAQDQSKRNIALETNEEICTPVEEVRPKMKEPSVFSPSEPPPAARIQTREEEPPKRNLNLNPEVIDTDKPDPVQAPDVVGHKTVIWNPTNQPIPFNKKANMVVADPLKNNDEIIFVDQQQERERRQMHPLLRDKPVTDDTEVQFVDQMQDEQRINAHPVLKNKPRDSGDINFV